MARKSFLTVMAGPLQRKLTLTLVISSALVAGCGLGSRIIATTQEAGP